MSREDFLTFTAPTGLRTSSLPSGFVLFITDTLESPGTFLLSHFVSRALRQPRPTLLVGISHTFDHYVAILRKTGVQLTTERDMGRFFFVDGSNLRLDDLYADIIAHAARLGGALVVIDDLSSLLWAGHSASDVASFFNRIQALVAQSEGSLVVLQHGDDLTAGGSTEDDALFRRVLQQSDLWLQTTSLSSQTRGELSIYRGPALVEDYGIVDRSGPTAWQYKLEEAGAVFSVKGLGKGFL